MLADKTLNEGGINVKDKQDWTILHYAVLHNDPKILNELIGCAERLGLNLGVQNKNKNGDTPRLLGEAAGNVNAAKMLLKNLNDQDAIILNHQKVGKYIKPFFNKLMGFSSQLKGTIIC